MTTTPPPSASRPGGDASRDVLPQGIPPQGIPPHDVPPHGVPFREALRVWVRIALSSFGGPAGQIAVMQRVLVDEKRWFSQDRFLHAMNYAMLLPGPEAQQLATYGGWMLHGWRGGLAAGGLFVLPGFLSILALSILYVGFREVGLVAALLFGVKPAILAIVLEAMHRLGKRAIRNRAMLAVAAAAFLAIFVFGVPFPAIVASAALIGFLGRNQVGGVLRPTPTSSLFHDDEAAAPPPGLGGTLRTVALWLAIWWIPVLALVPLVGSDDVLVTQGLFFSKVAVVTFGGAYAVLSYIAEQAVDVYAWLAPGEMLDGLGMAETTPGPLIQVVQFVGFLGAYRDPGALSPFAAGVAGSVVTTWVTFAPCFLWIFAGAPYVEHLRGRKGLDAALTAVTAAVSGVVLNLALWFGIRSLFAETRTFGGILDLTLPSPGSVDLAAAGIAAIAALVLFRLRWGIFGTIGTGAALGILHWLLSA